MHDINLLRKNPDSFASNLSQRGEKVDTNLILDLDKQRRHLVTELQKLQKERNDKSQSIGMIRDKSSQEFMDAREAVQEINNQIPVLKEQEANVENELNKILSFIPNLLADDVPQGQDESGNIVVDTIGVPKQFSFTPKHHFELGESLKMMDFTQTTKISGSRFVTLTGDLAKLERALANFMLDLHAKKGFKEVSVPLLVKSNAMYGTGNLPKFSEDAFQTNDGYWLIPTSEVSLTNLVADSIVNYSELPLRFTAHSACFRSEAGSAGRDTRGMVRLHQFSKVELVTITSEENHLEEYEYLTKSAEEILVSLDLPYQKVLKCAGDTTFSAQKTYDLEVWLPAQDCYREISSCSAFGQFQGRRMNARYKKPGDKESTHLYTMNGSGLAIGRTIVAILENYQNEDDSINVPEVLVAYMGGQKTIKA